jgi:hypothetical protein
VDSVTTTTSGARWLPAARQRPPRRHNTTAASTAERPPTSAATPSMTPSRDMHLHSSHSMIQVRSTSAQLTSSTPRRRTQWQGDPAGRQQPATSRVDRRPSATRVRRSRVHVAIPHVSAGAAVHASEMRGINHTAGWAQPTRQVRSPRQHDHTPQRLCCTTHEQHEARGRGGRRSENTHVRRQAAQLPSLLQSTVAWHDGIATARRRHGPS